MVGDQFKGWKIFYKCNNDVIEVLETDKAMMRFIIKKVDKSNKEQGDVMRKLSIRRPGHPVIEVFRRRICEREAIKVIIKRRLELLSRI